MNPPFCCNDGRLEPFQQRSELQSTFDEWRTADLIWSSSEGPARPHFCRMHHFNVSFPALRLSLGRSYKLLSITHMLQAGGRKSDVNMSLLGTGEAGYHRLHPEKLSPPPSFAFPSIALLVFPLSSRLPLRNWCCWQRGLSLDVMGTARWSLN